MQDRVLWNLTGGRVLGPAPFFVVGIVNVTPDSFYDGGSHDCVCDAVAHGMQLVHEGAMVLDVGGESTRPYAKMVGVEQEMARVLPVIKGLCSGIRAEGDEVAVSVDTYKAEVAAAALQAGASIVNDISACQFDPAMIDVLAQFKPGYVLMHSPGRPGRMQDDPRYDNVVDELIAFFEKHIRILTAAGLPEDNIVIDPGIGFGKTLEHNLQILSSIEAFGILGLPLFVGLSNKSMFGKLLDLDVDERKNATQAAIAVLASRGVRVHRVHEVALTMQTLTVAEAMRPGRRVLEAKGEL